MGQSSFFLDMTDIPRSAMNRYCKTAFSHRFACSLFILALSCVCSVLASAGFIYPKADGNYSVNRANLTVNEWDSVQAEWTIDPFTPLISIGLSCFESIDNATNRQTCGDSPCALDDDAPMGPCTFSKKELSMYTRLAAEIKHS